MSSHIVLDRSLHERSLPFYILQRARLTLSWMLDVVAPSRICRRRGQHSLGIEIFSYEPWDLDQRYNRQLVGRACRDCGSVIGFGR